MTGFHDYGLICCICYRGLTVEECAVDQQGQRWDVCSSAASEDPIPCTWQTRLIERGADHCIIEDDLASAP